MKGRHERIKKGWSGSAAVWLLLVPLFVLIVLKTDFLPQVARLGDTSFTKVADEMVQKVSSLGEHIAYVRCNMNNRVYVHIGPLITHQLEVN
jgi:hypothetical protein